MISKCRIQARGLSEMRRTNYTNVRVKDTGYQTRPRGSQPRTGVQYLEYKFLMSLGPWGTNFDASSNSSGVG
jgi:hypothetical protein